jgi:hypothetical protein
MACKYSNIAYWCMVAKDEDDRNGIFANYRFDIKSGYLSIGNLSSFENLIPKCRSKGYTLSDSESYINAASQEDISICYGKATLDIPSDGVYRVMTSGAFEREFKSFLSGITIAPDKINDLYDILRNNDYSIRDYINAKYTQDEAELYALRYMKGLTDIYDNVPENMVGIREVDMEKPVWVFDGKVNNIAIERYKSIYNAANYFTIRLSLYYDNIVESKSYKLLLMKFIPRNCEKKYLYKPTVFSGGYSNAYCSFPSKDDWGCTMVFSGNYNGLPEAIIKRELLGLAVDVIYLGATDNDERPKISSPDHNMILNKIMYNPLAPSYPNCYICEQIKE